MASRPQVEYYALSEPEMQELIQQAQDRNGMAQAELLKIFANFLHKYTVVLSGGRINFEDYDLRRFCALYVRDPKLRWALINNKLNEGGRAGVREAMGVITWMVNRYGDPEDVRQTIDLAFLQSVEIYRPRGEIPFSGYLYSYFFYVLKKQVDTLLVYQLGRKSYPLFDQEEWTEEQSPEGFMAPPAPPERSADEFIGAETIDELWVAGDTAFGAFAKLSVFERQLLKWRFIDGERLASIAARLTEGSSTLSFILNNIRDKLNAEGLSLDAFDAMDGVLVAV